MHRALMLIAGIFWGCLPPEPPAPSPATMRPPKAAPCLIVTPAELDFGEVANLNTHFKRLQITNPGGFMRTVTSDAPPLSFALSPQIDRQSVLIPPQSTRPISVLFEPRDALLHLGTLQLRGGPGCTVTVPLRGLGQGSVKMIPERLDFGFLQPGERKTLELTVVNSRRTSVMMSAVGILPEPSPAFTVLLPAQFELAASSAISFAITASPPSDDAYLAEIELGSPFGSFDTSLVVVGGAPVAELSTNRLEVPSVGWEPLSSPPSFADRVMHLRNVSTTGRSTQARLRLVPPFFEVEALAGVVSELRVEPSDELDLGVGLGQSAPLRVHFEPTSTGPHSHRVTLFTNDPIQPEHVFTFAANVERLPACSLEVSAQHELLLTAQPDGTSSGVVTFTNVGLSPCVVDDVRLDDPVALGYRLVNPEAQVTIAPGARHVVQIIGPRALLVSTTVLGFHVFNRGSVRQFITLQAPP